MAEYSGEILDLKAFLHDVETYRFKPGDPVELKVYYEVKRRNGVEAWFAWHAMVRVFDDLNNFLGEDETGFNMAPWTEEDTGPADPWHQPMYIKFTMPNRDILVLAELWAGG